MSNGAEAATTESLTLVVGVLRIESSPAQELERPAGAVPDTVQFWFGPNGSWKIRTYAVDHDVHTWHLKGFDLPRDTKRQFAADHIFKNYGDILSRLVTIELPNPGDPKAIQSTLSEHGLTTGGLQDAESDGNRWSFWTPDGAQYLTQTGETESA
jgi:hypothetical protein